MSRVELIAAGYQLEQILSCPKGDPCPCEYGVAAQRGYVRECGLARPAGPLGNFAVRTAMLKGPCD